MPNLWFPGADLSQRFDADYPGMVITPRVVVLHSTETDGWPGYRGGADAPNLTLRWDGTRMRYRQHHPANRTSRSLAHPAGTVETNRSPAGVFQIEMCGTSGWAKAAGIRPVWPEASDDMLAGVADVLRWLHTEWGVPLVTTPRPWGRWNGPDSRMSRAEWLAFRGVCGHQHVPANDHSDPGAINITRLLTLARTGRKDNIEMTKAELLASQIGYDGGKKSVRMDTALARGASAYDQLAELKTANRELRAEVDRLAKLVEALAK